MRNLKQWGRKVLALSLLSSLILSVPSAGFAAEPETDPNVETALKGMSLREQALECLFTNSSDLKETMPGGVLFMASDPSVKDRDFSGVLTLKDEKAEDAPASGILIKPEDAAPEKSSLFGCSGFPGAGIHALSDAGIADRLKPFQTQIEAGASLLFVSGEDEGLALSPETYSLAREKLSFSGLLVCEIPDQPVKALLAGADMAFTKDVDMAADSILAAIEDGTFKEEQLAKACSSVLSYKFTHDVLPSEAETDNDTSESEHLSEPKPVGPESDKPETDEQIPETVETPSDEIAVELSGDAVSGKERSGDAPAEEPVSLPSGSVMRMLAMECAAVLPSDPVYVPVTVYADGCLFEAGPAQVYLVDDTFCLKESEVRDTLSSFETFFPDEFGDHTFGILSHLTESAEILSDTFLTSKGTRYISLGKNTDYNQVSLIYLPNGEEPGTISSYELNERNGYFSIEVSDVYGASQEDLEDASTFIYAPAGMGVQFDLPWYDPPHVWRAAAQGYFTVRVQQVLSEEQQGNEPLYRAKVTITNLHGPALITSEERSDIRTGSLEILMRADGHLADEQDYHVTVTLQDPDGNPSEAVVGFCKFDASGKRVEYSSFSSDTKDFSLRNGEYVQLLDIPSGYRYTATEDTYQCKTQIQAGTEITETRTRKGEIGTSITSFTFLNHFASVPELPNTGETSGLYVILGGLALLVLGASILYTAKKR